MIKPIFQRLKFTLHSIKFFFPFRFVLVFSLSPSFVVYSSVYLTVSFTLERYISVCHPLRGQVLCTESRAKKVITGKIQNSFDRKAWDVIEIEFNRAWNIYKIIHQIQSAGKQVHLVYGILWLITFQSIF